jgi:hypothetical protein
MQARGDAARGVMSRRDAILAPAAAFSAVLLSQAFPQLAVP